MNKSFYHYMMRHRDSFYKNDFTTLALLMYEDHSFPKQATVYDEISSYLERSGAIDMSIFDRAWDEYIRETE